MPTDRAADDRSRTRRRGYSLMEVAVVVTLMSVILSMTAPSFQRAVETTRADLAAANLRALWAAERFYWLEYRTYTDDLSRLAALGLLDPQVPTASAPFAYSTTV